MVALLDHMVSHLNHVVSLSCPSGFTLTTLSHILTIWTHSDYIVSLLQDMISLPYKHGLTSSPYELTSSLHGHTS
jgi:hypothetical protein